MPRGAYTSSEAIPAAKKITPVLPRLAPAVRDAKNVVKVQ